CARRWPRPARTGTSARRGCARPGTRATSPNSTAGTGARTRPGPSGTPPPASRDPARPSVNGVWGRAHAGDDGRVALPRASYLVCASPRSGTELLCRGLAATGVAGRPQEYFLAEDPARLPGWGFWEEGPFAAGHDLNGRESYLALVYRLGSTP